MTCFVFIFAVLVFIFAEVLVVHAGEAGAGDDDAPRPGVENPPNESAVPREPAMITGVSWEREDTTVKVMVGTSRRIDYSAKVLSKTDAQPFRIVLDCDGALPGTLQPVIPVGEGVLERIRIGIMSQSPPKTRIVLDLSSPADYTVTDLPSGPGICISMKKGIRIESVWWERVEGGSVLKIGGTSLSSYRVTRLRAPERIVIDVPGASLAEHVPSSIEGNGAGVRRVRLGQFQTSPAVARVVVDLEDDVGAGIPFKISSDGENGSIVLLFSEAFPLRGRKVIVDPGHGGSDPGCISHSGLYEKHLTMSVARYLVAKLRTAGAEVVLTRNGDETVDAYKRVDLANRAGGDIYVSLHMNSFRMSQKSGVEVYYYSGVTQAKRLAQSIHKRLLEDTGFADSGIRVARFVVLKGTSMPSVVCEMGYLSNPDNERFLKNEAFHAVLAGAVYKGICDYFQDGDGKTRD
ncbi:MAG TPA: N-acetylmuramoyl-L-alanine amidase [Clostridia bacterium]|nr:N-acetylmuramoyl-L-alanine amidase [Clostridia bacterium]